MTTSANSQRDMNDRFPADLMRHVVWLYYRFSLSYRDVQELLRERGLTSPTKSRRLTPA